MTARLPLPPLPALTVLADTGRPVLAAVVHDLLEVGRETAVAMYEDSPYVVNRVRREQP